MDPFDRTRLPGHVILEDRRPDALRAREPRFKRPQRHAEAVVAVDELGSPEVSVAIRMLEGEALNMRRFIAACQSSPARARKALSRLEELGLVRVERLDQGATQVSRISLSPLGKEVATHFAAASGAMEKAKRKK